jgi:hypothetical protein
MKLPHFLRGHKYEFIGDTHFVECKVCHKQTTIGRLRMFN